LLFENYGQEIGGLIHCLSLNLKAGGTVSPVHTVVAPMHIHAYHVGLCLVTRWDGSWELVLYAERNRPSKLPLLSAADMSSLTENDRNLS